jgi:hypothetical protein
MGDVSAETGTSMREGTLFEAKFPQVRARIRYRVHLAGTGQGGLSSTVNPLTVSVRNPAWNDQTNAKVYVKAIQRFRQLFGVLPAAGRWLIPEPAVDRDVHHPW